MARSRGRRSRSGWRASPKPSPWSASLRCIQTTERGGQPDDLPASRSKTCRSTAATLLSLAALSAGVTPQAFNRGTQFGAAGSSRNQYVTIEGGRDSSTNYTVDGVYVRSLRFNNLSLGAADRCGSGSERAPQFVLDRVRAGTRGRVHRDQVGHAIDDGFGRTSSSGATSFDAKNYFAATKPELTRNQFGGDVRRPAAAGPHLRIRLGYEGLRTTKGLPFLASRAGSAFS